MGKIVHRYVFREVLVPFALGLSVFTFVLLLARLLKLVELVVSRGVPVTSIARLLAAILPAFLEVTVPMAMLLAILVAFGRLSADSEMVALRSSGLSLYQIVPPVAVFALLTMVATALLSFYARPWGNRSLRMTLYDIASTRATAGLKPQVFNDEFPGLVIYAERIDPRGDRLSHVLISDERDPDQRTTIFANAGTMISDRETQTVVLRLVDGWMYTLDGPGRAEYQTEFESYDVNLDLRESFAGQAQRELQPHELSFAELRAAIAAKHAAGGPARGERVEYHRKFSIPFACVVFALVAVPLGILPNRTAKSHGFAVSIALIFVYYVFLSAGQALAEQGRLPPAVGLWLPNVVLGALGVYLFRQSARGQSVVPIEWVTRAVAAARHRLAGRLGVEARS